MIAFLLGLLKIIGITLLVILILLLLIVGVVLFVPIRYSGEGQITADKKEANVMVTWLLKAVKVKLDYSFPEKPILLVKILGIDVLKFLEKFKNKSSKRQNKSNRNIEDEPNIPLDTPEESEQISEPSSPEPKQKTQETVAKEPDTQKTCNETVKADSKGQTSPKVPLREKIQTIIDKVKNIIYNIRYYIDVLQEEDTEQLLSEAWTAIVKILKSMAPKEFSLNAEFGLSSPDTTGKVYGMYTVVMPMIGDKVVLTPNFEEQVLRGDVALKGKITIWIILINALRILLDKRLQPLINKLKNGGNRNGGK